MISNGNKASACVVLYSGGTDSTCAAALMAENFCEIHLLTFYQGRMKQRCGITVNIRSLEGKFPQSRFLHKIIPVTRLVRLISYQHYLKYLFSYRWLILSTPGFTTLAWHINALAYCLRHNIRAVADGLTRELMHFPGHMDAVIEVFRKLYAEFGIEYINPVREWKTPADRQFIDRLIVDQHGYFFPGEENRTLEDGTTGQCLYRLGILPDPDIKGSALDRGMQYECYPFVLYNIMLFWIYLNFMPYQRLCERMESLFQKKAEDMRLLLKEYINQGEASRLSALLDKTQWQI